MEEQLNPYEPGQAHQHGYVDSSSSMPVTPGALGALLGTKFWVSLVGITMLIITAINILVFLFAGSQDPTGGLLLAYVAPLIMFTIQVILAVRLVQYGVAIRRLKDGGTSQDFERAMDIQSKFWKLSGIMCIVMISLTILTWLVMVMLLRSAF